MAPPRLARRLAEWGGAFALFGALLVVLGRTLFPDAWLPSWPEIFGWFGLALGALVLGAAGVAWAAPALRDR